MVCATLLLLLVVMVVETHSDSGVDLVSGSDSDSCRSSGLLPTPWLGKVVGGERGTVGLTGVSE